MKQIQVKLTDEERADTIYQRVWQNATTTAIVDALIKAHPEWKDVPRQDNPGRHANLQSVPR